MSLCLNISSISKSYHSTLALNQFTVMLTSGIYALLGPNGSGKSTLMNMLGCLDTPTSGKYVLDGEITYTSDDGVTENILKMGVRFREKLGFMPQYPGLYPNFTVERFMWYMAALKGLSRETAKAEIKEILTSVELDDVTKRKIGALSGGMKQRLALAQAVLGSPEILILDEPTAGLDPAGRESILKNIRDYQAAQQAAVVMVSHSMEEIASNVDRLIVMEKGTAVMTGAPSEVFSHAAELVSMGLNVPCMTQVLLRLQQLGVNVPASAYTVEQAADLLEPLLKGGAQIC